MDKEDKQQLIEIMMIMHTLIDALHEYVDAIKEDNYDNIAHRKSVYESGKRILERRVREFGGEEVEKYIKEIMSKYEGKM